jgi:glycerol kinase
VVLSLDCGSHAVRLFGYPEGGGDPIDLGSAAIESFYPKPGFVEVNPRIIAHQSIELLREGIRRLVDEGAEPVCLGMTNMRETAVAWRADSGEPVHAAIHWMSLQSQPQVDRWAVDGTAERIRQVTGTMNEAFFFGSKIRWLLDNSQEARDHLLAQNLRVGTLETWLLYVLTGGTLHATDVSNASRSQMMDLKTLAWDSELVEAVGLTLESLPEISPTFGHYGVTDSMVVGAEIAISGVIADQQASLFGHGAVSPGDVKATFGTSGVVCLNLGDQIRLEEGLVTSVAWSGDSAGTVLYEIEASAFHSGSTISWLGDRLSNVDPWSKEMTHSTSPAHFRPYVIPAFTQLGAPRWPRRTGGAIAGLQLDTSTADIVRAGFEAMAFQAYDTLRFLESSPAVISVDGGGAASRYLCQTLANLSQATVSRSTNLEITAAGTAMMAIRGIGESVDSWFPPEPGERIVFEPQDDAGYAQEGYAHWVDLVERVLGDGPRETLGTVARG